MNRDADGDGSAGSRDGGAGGKEKPVATGMVGPYRIEERLGVGGMGAVYRAWDSRLRRTVAVKQMLAEMAALPEIRQRFYREARAIAKLNHAAIVRIFDVFESDDGDWIVMELVKGSSLKNLLRERSLKISEALDLARQIAEGLAAAHEGGVAHRDLKVENIMVTPSGRIKILDFGLAKWLDPGAEKSTLSTQGLIMGTVRSMSPEQAMGRVVDHRSDLFSFGVLLFEILTGQSPFQGSNAMTLMNRICQKPHPALNALNPAVPPELVRLIDHLLAKAPDDRPDRADKVASALGKIREHVEGLDLVETSGFFKKALLMTDLDCDACTEESLLFENYDRLVHDLLAAWDGLEVEKSPGFVPSEGFKGGKDFLLLFDEPEKAVGYVLAYLDRLAELERTSGVELRSRAAVHYDRVYLRGNPAADVARGARAREAIGVARNVTARTLALAHPGQLLVTDTAFEKAGPGLDDRELDFTSHGRFTLAKDVELEVFEIARHGAAHLPAPVEPAAVPGTDAAERVTAESSASHRGDSVPSGGSKGGRDSVLTATVPALPRGLKAQRTIELPAVTGGWRRLLVVSAALFAAFILGVGVTALLLSGAADDTPPKTGQEARRLAVLGFLDLDPGPRSAWLSRALSEMLAVELDKTSRIRLVAGESVARIEDIELPLSVFDPRRLEEIGEHLETDLVVFGTYELTAHGDVSRCRLKAVLQDRGGEVLAEVHESGTEAELFELIVRTARVLRDAFEDAG